jgi:hypothetical protein
VSELEVCCGSVLVRSCCEKLVAEVEDSLGTQRKGMSTTGGHYQPVASEECKICEVCRTVTA